MVSNVYLQFKSFELKCDHFVLIVMFKGQFLACLIKSHC